jgi:hypothetical protein
MDSLPDNKKIDLQLYILDPLSVIIKLAILSNREVGTKICISTNIIYLQEPGPFQAFCRYIFNSNKTDIQYLYNPIELACQQYLSKTCIQQNPKIKDLFKCAQNGIIKLMETYKNCAVMRLCLNYYLSIITNHLEEKNNDTLFYKIRREYYTPPACQDCKPLVWIDTITQAYMELDSIAKHYNQTFQYSIKDTFYNDFCNRRVWGQHPDKLDSMWFEPVKHFTYFVEGLGGPFYIKEFSQGGPTKLDFVLTYYKKDGGSCGNFVNDVQDFNVQNLQATIFPNPLNVKSTNETFEYFLFYFNIILLVKKSFHTIKPIHLNEL